MLSGSMAEGIIQPTGSTPSLTLLLRSSTSVFAVKALTKL